MSNRLMMSGAAVLFALTATAGPAVALEAPEPTRGSTVTEPGPPKYPAYDPQYEVPAVAAQDSGVDKSSAALGALGGIALTGVGFGIAFAVARRRDHASTAPQAA